MSLILKITKAKTKKKKRTFFNLYNFNTQNIILDILIIKTIIFLICYTKFCEIMIV